jgi:class 3 adenylate cyclase
MNKGRVAVITSCFNHTFKETAVRLAELGIRELDVYWPNLKDTAFFETHRPPLGRLVGDQWELTDADAIFGWLKQELAAAEDEARTRLRIVSFTTSYPSISEVSNSINQQIGINQQIDAQSVAVTSIATLLKVAEKFRLPNIQLRAGRRLFKSTFDDGDHLAYNRDELERLKQSLIQIYQAYHPTLKGHPKVAIALELEPGEGFLLRSMEYVRSLRNDLYGMYDREELPKHWVGLNLDMGHCLILNNGNRINPEEFEDGLTHLLLPIYGAHISDHSIHHAADLAPGFFNSVRSFDDYLTFYLNKVPHYYKPGSVQAKYYSGHISLELEAVEYLHHVARAHRTINWRLFDLGSKLNLELHPRQQKPQETEACVIFADLRGSTELTCAIQGTDPDNFNFDGLVEFTNQINNICLQNVREIEPQARLDKFIGDAVMIVLEGPMTEMANASIRIARKIQTEIQNQAPDILRGFRGVGIGISGGKMVRGYIGPKAFEEETVLGREVIFASRLSGVASPGQILTTPSFHSYYHQYISQDEGRDTEDDLWEKVTDSSVRLDSPEQAEPYWIYDYTKRSSGPR